MWFGLRMSSKANAGFVSAVTDLLQSTLRALILATSGICLAWYLVGALVDWPMASLGSTFLVALVVITVAAVALYVLPKRLLAAQVWWLVGVGGAIVLAAYLFRRPEIALLFALLPLMAVITVGWPACSPRASWWSGCGGSAALCCRARSLFLTAWASSPVGLSPGHWAGR